MINPSLDNVAPLIKTTPLMLQSDALDLNDFEIYSDIPNEKRAILNLTKHPEREDLPAGSLFHQELEKWQGEETFCQPTKEGERLIPMLPYLPEFSTLGRTRIVKMPAGSFFPPHRDLDYQTIFPNWFRLIIPLYGFDSSTHSFVLGGKEYNLELGRGYFVNTNLVHSLTSFTDDLIFIIASIPWSDENKKILLKLIDRSFSV